MHIYVIGFPLFLFLKTSNNPLTKSGQERQKFYAISLAKQYSIDILWRTYSKGFNNDCIVMFLRSSGKIAHISNETTGIKTSPSCHSHGNDIVSVLISWFPNPTLEKIPSDGLFNFASWMREGKKKNLYIISSNSYIHIAQTLLYWNLNEGRRCFKNNGTANAEYQRKRYKLAPRAMIYQVWTWNP